MNTLLRVGSAATLSLVMLGLVGCRSSKSNTSTYTGLMSGRGNIPPAYVEVKPIPRVIGGADASTGISVFDEIGGESGFEVESPILEDEVAPAEVETVDAPKDAAPATPGHRVLPKVPNGDSVPALATDKSGVRVYVVRGGDTLSRIAAAHGVKTTDMMAANPTLKSADKIFVGQKLNLPANAKGVSRRAPPPAPPRLPPSPEPTRPSPPTANTPSAPAIRFGQLPAATGSRAMTSAAGAISPPTISRSDRSSS